MLAVLHTTVLETIRRHRMCRAGDSVAVAVSGGADSTALLLLLRELARDLGVSLSVAHFNHCLRGAESDADQEFVQQLAARLELDLAAGREDVAAGCRNHENLEAAARRMRYAFLNSLVAEGRATRVAVAHTAEDQAETVLAHITRGTGPAGLAGIYPVAGAVVRPLLDVRREALRTFLREKGQPWREDSSNADRARLRTQMRTELLPHWASVTGADVVEQLCRLAQHARVDEQFWDAILQDIFLRTVRRDNEGLRIAVSDLLAPTANVTGGASPPEVVTATLSQRLVRRILLELRGDRHVATSAHVAQVLRLARDSISGRRTGLPGGVEVERIFDDLVFWRRNSLSGRIPSAETARVPISYQHTLDLPPPGSAGISLAAGAKRLRLKVIDWPAGESETRRLASALDCAHLHPPLVLRNWQPGDAYRPAGRQRSRKLKEMFRERRISRSDRLTWPVLLSGGNPVWAAGFPVATEALVTRETRRALVITEESS